MFSRLERKIVFSIVISSMVFVLLISTVTFLLIQKSYVRTYVDRAVETVRLAIDYSEIKIDNILSDSLRTVSDETVMTGLASDHYVTSINPKLNFLRSLYQEEVVGLTIYSTNGIVYKTDSLPVSEIIPFSELHDDPAIGDFLASDQEGGQFIIVENGVVRYFSLMEKIRNADDVLLGYFLINIDPDYLFNQFFSFQSNSQIDLVQNYVVVGEEIVAPSVHLIGSDSGLAELAQTTESGSFTEGKSYFIVKEPLFQNGAELVTVLDPTSLNDSVRSLILAMAAISVFVTVASFLVALAEAKAISAKLTKLADKMQSATDVMK